ncbi:MAG: hypothetical protein WAV32_02840 [Halobacteriota archaeon]
MDIIEMCNTRQVVVFTHRLSMFSLLHEFAKKHSIDPQVVCLQCEPWGIGEPADTPLFAKRPDKALNTILYERLPRARKVQFFDDMMTKYSRYAHSQPNEAPVKYPPPDKLQEDMESLKSWFEEFKKRDSAG